MVILANDSETSLAQSASDSQTIPNLSYDCNLIKYVALSESDYLDVPLCTYMKDSYTILQEGKSEVQPTKHELHIRGNVSKILLHNVPHANYILNVDGHNMCTSKANVFDLTSPKVNSMLEIRQSIQGTYNCLNFDLVDNVRIIVPSAVTDMPLRFQYTLLYAPAVATTPLVSTYYGDAVNLQESDRVVAIDIPYNHECLFMIEGRQQVHVSDRSPALRPRVARIYFNDSRKQDQLHYLDFRTIDRAQVVSDVTMSQYNKLYYEVREIVRSKSYLD